MIEKNSPTPRYENKPIEARFASLPSLLIKS